MAHGVADLDKIHTYQRIYVSRGLHQLPNPSSFLGAAGNATELVSPINIPLIATSSLPSDVFLSGFPTCNWTNGVGQPKLIPSTQVHQASQLTGYTCSEVQQQQSQIVAPDGTIHTSIIKDGIYGISTDPKLGPVEKAVLHQAMYNQSKKMTPEMRRCNDCNVIFNSQNQAEMHYKGKKHAKVMFLKRNRETKRSPTKVNLLTMGSNELSNLPADSNDHSTDESSPDMIGPKWEKLIEYENSTSPDNSANSNLMTHNVTHTNEFTNQKAVSPVLQSAVDGNDQEDTKLTSAIVPVCSSSPIIEDSDRITEEDDNKLKSGVAIVQREPVILPDPLPRYISRIEKPTVLKESLRCAVCDIYVNSENQMRQHVNSLRHKNIEKGIPTPPKPIKEDKPKGRSEQFRCEVCRVTLNSDIQLLQHLSSQRHKNILEGKPPKPRWTPYERTQHAILRSAAHLRLSTLKTIPSVGSPILLPPTITNSPAALPIGAHAGLNPSLIAPQANPTHLKQMAYISPNGSILQAQEIVYIGTPPPSFSAAQQPQQIQTAAGPLVQSHVSGVPQDLTTLINASCMGLEPRELTFNWNP